MEYQIYKDRAGEFRWRLKAANGEIIAVSGEGYKNLSDCQSIIHKINDTKAPIYYGTDETPDR